MKVLFIDDDAPRQFAIAAAENVFQEVSLYEAASIKKANSLLDEYSDIECIIYSKEYSEEDISQIKSRGEVPKIKNESYASVIQVLNSLPFKHPKYSNEEYFRVRTPFFWRFDTSIVDTFVGLSDVKYVKILHKDDHYNREIIEKYAKKNQAHLFIKRDDCEVFAEKYINLPYLSCTNEESTEDEVATTTIALSQEIVQKVGVTKNVIAMADSFVKTTLKSKKNINLVKLLKKARHNKNYIYDHSFFLAYVNIKVCDHIDWANEGIVEKLCLAAMFHDITIEDPEMGMLQDLDDSVLLNYSADQINEYTNHPQEICRIIKEADNFPLNIEEIVLQHHEKVDGSGFPNKISGRRISKLAAVFIMSHEFVTQLYRIGFNSRLIPNVLKEMSEKFNEGQFANLCPAFNEAFGEEE